MSRAPLLPLVHGLAALLAGVALFAFRDLPLVDLPQHAAQVATWARWDDPGFARDELELNFRTPYLVAYPLALFLTPWFGATGAFKVVLFAALCLQALGLHALVRRLGHEPFLGLLAWPIGLGYCFLFGFVSYIAAVPALYFAVERAVAHSRSPGPESSAWLGALLCLCLVAHGIMFALALFAVVPLLVRGGGTLVARFAPLLAPLVLGALWILPGTSTARIGGDYWGLSLIRFVELPALLVGIGSSDAWANVFGIALLVLVGLSVRGAERSLIRFLPLAVTLAGYGLWPTLFRGVGPLSPRFVTLLVPAILIAFRPRADSDWVDARRKLSRVGLAGLAVAVPALFTARLVEFNRETSAFHALVARMPPDLRVRPIVFDRTSPAFPGVPALLHFPAYYQVEKGGTQGYSFAMYPLSVVRLRPGVEPSMPDALEWRPELFDAAREAAGYDYFLVHSHADRSEQLFATAGAKVVLEERHGSWWGYRNTHRHP